MGRGARARRSAPRPSPLAARWAGAGARGLSPRPRPCLCPCPQEGTKKCLEQSQHQPAKNANSISAQGLDFLRSQIVRVDGYRKRRRTGQKLGQNRLPPSWRQIIQVINYPVDLPAERGVLKRHQSQISLDFLGVVLGHFLVDL